MCLRLRRSKGRETKDVEMIIDHVDQIELAEEVVQAHKNELNSLRYLAQGLHLLYAQVKRIEDKVLERLDPDLKFSCTAMHRS